MLRKLIWLLFFLSISAVSASAQNFFSGTLNLSTLTGQNGFVLNGIDAEDQSGISVSSAGDVNGDGIDDLIIGAYWADPGGNSRAGESYVVFGSQSSFPASLNLGSLTGQNGFVLNGIDAGDQSGVSVSSAGDVNGDGIDDLIIGAYAANPGGNIEAGESYVVFGSQSSFPAAFNLGSLTGQDGFVLNGIDAGDRSGVRVSSAGDVNGDGIDDLIIGAYWADPGGNTSAGESYVVFGSQSSFPASLNLGSLTGQDGFVLNGIDAGDFSGVSVSSAGDVNGDGIDDLIIGAYWADPGGNTSAGESYVVFGSQSSFPASLNLGSLTGQDGFVLNGIDAYDFSGVSVSSAGDVNGDGIDDLIIGAYGADPGGNSRAGESYVVFGITGFTWTPLTGGDFDTAENWLGGKVPTGNVGVIIIEPDFGGTINGPTGAVIADRLELAADSGILTLDMLATGLLRVRQTLFTLDSSVRLTGDGTFVVDNRLDNLGEINLGTQGQIVANQLYNFGLLRGMGTFDTPVYNYGRIEAFDQPGELEFVQNFFNQTGVISVRDSTLRFGVPLVNQGQLSFGDGVSDVFGSLINFTQGTVALSGNATVSLVGNVVQDGTLNLLSGSRLVVFQNFSGSGGTTGGGTLEVLGSLSPGSSTALVSFGGDVIFGPNASAEIEIQGIAPGSEYDRIDVGGIVSLAGTLDFAPLSPYGDPTLPGDVDSFVFIVASDVVGEFDEVTYDGTPLDETFTTASTIRSHQGSGLFRILGYGSDNVTFANYQALEGDANGDGIVDGSDFGIWNANKFTSGRDWITGDFNGDGVTDGSDFGIWNANKFTSVADLGAVPEPCGQILLLLAILLVPRGIRRTKICRFQALLPPGQ